MIKDIFRQIAKQENGKFYFQDKDIAIGGGVRSPNVIYIVKFDYKGNQFIIDNRSGTSFVGTINCKLSTYLQPIAFEINTISHLKNLFLRKKSRFKIKTINKNIEYYLHKNKALELLSTIANKDNFSPFISCDSDNNSWDITCNYHLEFDDWTQVINPIIELYKNLIDEFEKGIANISPKTYREAN